LAKIEAGRLVTLLVRHCALVSGLLVEKLLFLKSFSSNDFPMISLVIEEEESVGSAIAARTVPMRSLLIVEILQFDNAFLPV
jgi:hypothetical protein